MEDKHKNCDGGLIPACNIKNCYVCLKCQRFYLIENKTKRG